jgi:16S rRNA (uracil1498-N3)-methyltransferase
MSSIHRFHLPPAAMAGGSPALTGREAHHALDVLRLKDGDRLTVLDGAGHEYLCEIKSHARQRVELSVRQNNFTPPLPCQITLLQALPKGKIIESIIQKAVELGAHRIVPLLTERVVAQLDGESATHKREKWQQVAIEAVKQCGAAWLPEIETPQTSAQFLARKESFDLSLVGALQANRRHPRDCFREFEKQHRRLPRSIGVWIGPEGDFTPAELQTIQAAGALPISLGRLVLRVETAAIYCLSILNYELQG